MAVIYGDGGVDVNLRDRESYNRPRWDLVRSAVPLNPFPPPRKTSLGH